MYRESETPYKIPNWRGQVRRRMSCGEGSSDKAGATRNGVWKILKYEDAFMSLVYSKNYCHNNI